jgi:twitching motility protein PilT
MNEPLDLLQLLASTVQHGASDLHLHQGAPPLLRVHGELHPLGEAVLDGDSCRNLILSALTDEQRIKFEENRELDFALEIPNLGRFRGNAHFSRGGAEAVYRHILTNLPTLEGLGHRPTMIDLCKREEGLILITGMTGSGKTSTMAAMVQRISSLRTGVIITIEDPIEFIFPDNLCIIKQREVGQDTKTFAAGLRHIVKQDPDVIIIGEMGDRDTMQIALTAAETGHLVIGTLHTIDAANAIHRIVDFFPPEHQNQIITQLSSSLVAVVSQRLLPRADGKGRVMATETMVLNSGVQACIRERKIHQLPGLMEIGAQDGMNTLDQALVELVEKNLITHEEALIHARDPERIPKPPPPKKRGLFG